MVTEVPTLTDMEQRLVLMDKYGIDIHVLVLVSPAVEVVVSDSGRAAELSALANDGIAEVVSQYPERFIGVASVAMNNPETMVAIGYDYGASLPRPYIDYFKMFYADTASMGSTPALINACAFFGADHLVFGTDVPFDKEHGEILTRETLGAVERMKVSRAEFEQIMSKNILKLLKREGARL